LLRLLNGPAAAKKVEYTRRIDVQHLRGIAPLCQAAAAGEGGFIPWD
jgi:hypothetical protein